MYFECKLTVDGATTEYVDSFRGGQPVCGEVEDDPLRHSTIDLLHRWVRQHDKFCRKHELELLGRHLYALLFSSSVREAFMRTYEYFDAARKGDDKSKLRFTLIFKKNAGDIANYPWEFLFLPLSDNGKFLAGEITQLILTRFVPEVKDQDASLANQRPLRILVADCQPEGLPAIKSGTFLDALGKLNGNMVVTTLPNPTYTDLEKAVAKLDEPVHVLHFIGHGKPGQLAMKKPKDAWQAEDAENRRVANETGTEYKKPHGYVWISDTALRSLLEEHPPRVVFLHACDGAAGESLENFRSTARTLVYAKVPAVVAMQYPISNEDAAIFATTFYTQLAAGQYLDEAVVAGRRQLATFRTAKLGVGWDDRSFGTPVVYLQARDAIMPPGPPVTRQPAESTAAPTGPKKVPCPACDRYVWPSQMACCCGVLLQKCPNAGEPPGHMKELDRECLFCRPQKQRVESRALVTGAPVLARNLSVRGEDGA